MNLVNILIDIGGTLLSLVLFFVALGVLVTIHELGHFIAAKSFKVYCTDFSIGFGPKILKIKRKKGETTYSIGILPLGGYVSMLGEEGEDNTLPEGVVVPESRTLNGIKRWKRVVIMAAGITMNFILAYIIFVICAGCFLQVQVNAFYDVNESVAQKYFIDEGHEFSSNDQLYTKPFVLTYNENGEKIWEEEDGTNSSDNSNTLRLLHKGYIESSTNPGKKYIASLSYTFTQGVNDTDITKNIYLYETTSDASMDEYNFPVFVENTVTSYTFTDGDIFELPVMYYNALTNEEVTDINQRVEYETEDGKYKLYNGTLKLVVSDGAFENVGISFHKYNYWNGAKSFQVAGDLWLNSTTLISSALGKLFIGQGWDQVGGPLAIFTQTTTILKNNPFYFYLQTWGVISVNLALFNLLPFPGLDGWQILVEIVEGSVNFAKKTTFKAKNKGKVKNKPLDENSSEEAISISANEVTTNKDANLTIGEKNSNNEYKEWKIPAKVKGIMSYIGLGLLFVLMIFVIIKDIIGIL